MRVSEPNPNDTHFVSDFSSFGDCQSNGPRATIPANETYNMTFKSNLCNSARNLTAWRAPTAVESVESRSILASTNVESTVDASEENMKVFVGGEVIGSRLTAAHFTQGLPTRPPQRKSANLTSKSLLLGVFDAHCVEDFSKLQIRMEFQASRRNF